MAQVMLPAGRRHAPSLAREIVQNAKEHRDVVLVLKDDVRPVRVLKIIQATVGRRMVEIIIRHAALREYLEHAVAGAAVGAAVSAASVVLAALANRSPIPVRLVLTVAAIGAVIGAIILGGTTPIAQIRVYKLQGHTRLKFVAKG